MKKNLLITFSCFLLVSCHNDHKKQVITGMDQGLDSLLTKKQVFIPDSLHKDSNAVRGDILAHEHDSLFRERQKQMMPGVFSTRGNKSLALFIVQLKQFVVTNNKLQVANLVKYPLTPTIRNTREFAKNYENLFTAAVKNALATTNPGLVAVSTNNIKIANGKIWLAEEGKYFKIIRINN